MPTAKPKILVFTLAYYPYIGGAEIAVQEIVKRLREQFEFEVVTYKFDRALPDFEFIDGIPVHRVPGRFLGKYSYFWQALKLAERLQKKNNYQIVWGIMGSHGGLAAWLFKRRFPQVKYLLTEQSGDSHLFWLIRTWWWRPWFKRIYKEADFIQVISSYLAKLVRSYGYQGSLKIVPNGISSHWHQTEQLVNTPLANVIPTDSKVILSVSRLVKKNGLKDLIRALLFLPTEYQLVVIGEGPERRKLERLSRKLGVNQRVHLLGKIPYARLSQYYLAADVFCRPSLSEGLGNVFLEAMAMGLPVVATPVGGIVDIVKDKKTGLLAKVGDAHDIADKIKMAVASDDLRKKIIAQSKEMVNNGYTWEKVAEKMSQIFIKLAG